MEGRSLLYLPSLSDDCPLAVFPGHLLGFLSTSTRLSFTRGRQPTEDVLSRLVRRNVVNAAEAVMVNDKWYILRPEQKPGYVILVTENIMLNR